MNRTESQKGSDMYQNQTDAQSLIHSHMQDCILCPRVCHADRTSGQTGFCGQTAQLTAARAALHFWEEPCISGTKGSGTVFFSGCSLRCVFCQNHDIALGEKGKPISLERLSDIFLKLQEQGAHNINLVTPTHFIPQIRYALIQAKEQGLSIPIVYNTSGYEEVASLRLLEGLIDIYLPDLKYHSPELSRAFSHTSDYFEKATAAIAEMFRQVGTPVFDRNGMMRKGMIVRHLLLPGQAKDSKKILRYLYETYHNDIYVSIMNQYTPLPHVASIPELNRKVTPEEYDRVLRFAETIGIEQGFLQEGDAADESFIPPFNFEGIL
uniref:radical SAM protein n=1 Tax=Acetatifactor sp. TaxID=1872090 RepID=UPI004055DF66